MSELAVTFQYVHDIDIILMGWRDVSEIVNGSNRQVVSLEATVRKSMYSKCILIGNGLEIMCVCMGVSVIR